MAKSKSIAPTFCYSAAISESNGLELDIIKVRKQNRDSTAGNLRPIVAIDTETQNGNIFLIADSNGNWLEHPDITFENVATFLLKHETSWIFCYNLHFDAGSILKLLPPNTLRSYKKSKQLKF